mmetsp:Transcript_1397/g.3423  ORF Transcript_1397/g.3423 Transcript_1397/m.3423 type:complete len:235 (-) Transcript_1397:255-959(-)
MAEAEAPAVSEQEVDESVQAMLAALKATKKKKSSSKKKSSKVKEEEGGDAATATTAEQGSAVKRSIHDAADGEYSFKYMLDRVYTELRANNPDLVDKKRAVLRPPEVLRVGTTKILWSNFPEICKMMKRDPEHVFRFFLAELGTTGSIDGDGRLVIKGKFVPKYIESLLKKYISEYVSCGMCRQVDTKLVRDQISRMYFMHCSSCGASRAVSSIQKGYHATGRGERRAARYAAQ